MSQVDAFEKRLKKHSLRVTKERVALFTALATHQSPIAISELASTCSNIMDEATVYRNIALFEKLDITHRVYSGWKYEIELSDRYMPHHHHMTCERCGQITSFDEPLSFVESLKEISHEHKFQLRSHSLELHGLCDSCSQ